MAAVNNYGITIMNFLVASQFAWYLFAVDGTRALRISELIAPGGMEARVRRKAPQQVGHGYVFARFERSNTVRGLI